MPKIVAEKNLYQNSVRLYEYENETKPGRFLKSFPYYQEIEDHQYEFLSNGNHNLVYRSTDRLLVFKRVINPTVDSTDTPERSVRLWNLLNPDLKARVTYSDGGDAIDWIVPFIEGTQPTEYEIVKKLFEIYQMTGRIVVDAFVMSNFIKISSGAVVCIDVGFSLRLEKRLEKQQSVESLAFWDLKGMSRVYTDTFMDIENKFKCCPLLIKAIKALLYLQMHRPDFREVIYLNSSLIQRLAEGYDKNNELRHSNPEQIISDLDIQLSNLPCLFAVSTLWPPTLLVSSTVELGLFAKKLSEIKKPESWLDFFAKRTSAAWCDKY